MTRGPADPEFMLAAACCRWPADRAAVRSAATASIDWPRFERIVQRHRIAGLVWHGLRHAGVAPAPLQAQHLKAAAHAIAVQNLTVAAEMNRIDQAFDQAGIDRLFLKGLTLAVLVYGSPTLKQAWDVDLLVPPALLPRAATALRRIGYRCRTLGDEAPEDALRGWHGVQKESVWHHPARNVYLELHIRLLDGPPLIPTFGLNSPRQTVTVAGTALATFADEELFTYLCVHGTSCGWHRLKWLADLAAFLARTDAVGIEALYRRSVELGGGRSAAVALLMCRRFLATELPASLSVELEADRATRLMVKVATRMMIRHGATERTATTTAFQIERMIHLLILPGWSAKGAELVRQVRSPADRYYPHLPRWLRPFALPLVMPRYVARQIIRTGRFAVRSVRSPHQVSIHRGNRQR